MTDAQFSDLAKRVGLEHVSACYPALVRAAMERGLNVTPGLDSVRSPITEPAHYFVVPQDQA